MIAKLVKGCGFRGALEYNLTKERGHILDTNMAGERPRELAAEFGEIRRLRPNLGKAVLHVSLSAAPGEKLSDNQWRDIGHRYLQGMGFTNNQFIITRHTDTEHEHIHILVNRIQFNGQVVSDSQDYRRQEMIMRTIERDYSLQSVTPSIEVERRAPTKGEIEHGLRTGEASTRQQLQQLADAAAQTCPSFTEYAERLETVGVELVPVVQLNGAKLSGLSYRLDGVTMKGSNLGKAYSPVGLAKRGVMYEQDRDFATVRRANERDAARAFGLPDREHEASQAPERGGVSHDPGTPSPGNGSISRRDLADISRDRAPQPAASRELPAADWPRDLGLDRCHRESEPSRQQLEPSRSADRVATLRPSRAYGHGYGSARDRILALAGTAQNPEPAGLTGSRRVAEASLDRTTAAIQRQTTALGVDRFEIGIRDARTGQMMNRTWSRIEIEKNTAWLRRMNARGNDIYVRPAGEHGLVLVDDLKPEALQQMQHDGFAPAAMIETSPGNYQAWIKLADQPVPAALRQAVARELAQTYDGDLHSADSRHYGRLAGFTNQKPQYSRSGQQPYVLAHECPGKAARSASEALERMGQYLDKAEAQKTRETRLAALKQAFVPAYPHSPIHEYQRQAKRLLDRYGVSTDLSRMDWMISTDMAKSGRFSQQDIENAIRECSPNVESRKIGHTDDYAKRTAEKAWNTPDVAECRRQAERAAGRNHDFGIDL